MSKNIDLNDYEEHKLIKKDIIEGKAKTYDFPKYTTQIINLANQNNQGTRPVVVGQMSELIKECPHNSYDAWQLWYMSKYPDAIDKATDKAYEGVKNLQKASKLITKEMVKQWITDLVITKTAEGLIFQEAVIKYIAELEGKEWRLANPDEESKGIDGFIGDKAVQVKSTSYESKKLLPENIPCDIIYYDKGSKGSKFLKVYYKKN